VTSGSGDFGLLCYTGQAFADFTLRVHFRIVDPIYRKSGILLRFHDPMADPTPVIAQRIRDAGDAALFGTNRAWSAVHPGFEAQIDDLGRGDPRKDFYGIRPEPSGLRKNRTGALHRITLMAPVRGGSSLSGWVRRRYRGCSRLSGAPVAGGCSYAQAGCYVIVERGAGGGRRPLVDPRQFRRSRFDHGVEEAGGGIALIGAAQIEVLAGELE
jgi:hypothetical protein